MDIFKEPDAFSQEWYERNKGKLMSLGEAIEQYLAKEKVFIPNPERFKEVNLATEIARKLFYDFEISVEHDPLQSGALVIKLTGYYMQVAGPTEITEFKDLILLSDNFEISPVKGNKLQMNIMFYGALKKIK